MKNLWRRIRAALGMGVIWAVAWSLAGGLVARLPSVNSDLPLPLLFGPLGFITGMIFSGVLVAIGRRHKFEGVSLSRFAGWGAASGMLLSGIFVAGAALRGGNVVGDLLLFGPSLAIASAACAAGSLALARRAERLGLPGAAAEKKELQG